MGQLPLRIDESGLWAHVKFTPRAAELVRAGEYRFCSAVWMFDTIDRVTGEEVLAELHSVALTNTPFIDGLQPIVLGSDDSASTWIHVAKEGAWKGHYAGPFDITREHMECALAQAAKNETPLVLDYHHQTLEGDVAPAAGWIELQRALALEGESMDPIEQLAAVLEALSLPADASPEAIKKKLDELVAKAAKSEDGAVENSRTVANEAGAALAEILVMLQDASGLDEAGVLAGLREKALEIGALLASQPENGSDAGDGSTVPNTRALSSINKLMKAQLETAKRELSRYKDEEFNRDFEAGCRTGSVTPDMRALAKEVFLSSKTNFKKLVDRKIAPMSNQATTPAPHKKLSEAEERVALSWASARRISIEEARKQVSERNQ